MDATKILMNEHEVILTALAVLDALATRLEKGEDAPAAVFDQLVEFFRVYADKCHHAKEERTLFPALVEAGLPDRGGPVGVMLHEHDIGRGYLAQLREYVPGLPGTRLELAKAARNYDALLGPHISKENDVLFMMADRLLAGPADRKMVEEFDAHERTELGADGKAKFERTIDELSKQYLGGKRATATSHAGGCH